MAAVARAGGSETTWTPSHNPWLIAVAVMLGTFMEVLDTSVANVALPHIAGSMASTAEEATWMVTSYLVANAIVLPLTGWLSTTFGRKRFLITCIILFTAASVWSGASTSLAMLVVARIVQGMGGGALQPTAQAVLLESFPPKRRGTAMAFYGVGVVVAPILGPIVGGYLTDNYTWRWAFYINLPIGILAILMAMVFIEDPPYLKRMRTSSIDFAGFFSLAMWVGALQVVLDQGQQKDWFGSGLILTLAITSVVTVMFFLNWELWVKEPVVDLRILKDTNFALATVMIGVVGAVLYGSITLLPLFMQQLVGFPAFDAGLAMAPRGAGALSAMLVVGTLLSRFDGRYFVGVGFFLLGLSNLWLSDINLQIGIMNVAAPNVLQGFGVGLIFVPLTTLGNAHLPVERMGMGSGIYNLMRNLGGSVGIALCTTSLSRGAQRFQNYLVDRITAFNQVYVHFSHTVSRILGVHAGSIQTAAFAYRTLQQQSAVLAYVNTYIVMGWACFACIPLVFLMHKGVSGGGAPGAH